MTKAWLVPAIRLRPVGGQTGQGGKVKASLFITTRSGAVYRIPGGCSRWGSDWGARAVRGLPRGGVALLRRALLTGEAQAFLWPAPVEAGQDWRRVVPVGGRLYARAPLPGQPRPAFEAAVDLLRLPEPWACPCGARGTWEGAVVGSSGPDNVPTAWPCCPYGHGTVGPGVPRVAYLLVHR